MSWKQHEAEGTAIDHSQETGSINAKDVLVLSKVSLSTMIRHILRIKA